MSEFPETRQSLIVRIQSPSDDEAWSEFVAIYWPVVYRLARKRGLQDADAEDLSQKIIWAGRRAIRNWEPNPARGKFRFWLATVTRNAILNALTRKLPDAAVGGTSVRELMEQQTEPDRHVRENLEREYRRSLFRRAAQRIRQDFQNETWNAFWLTTVEGVGVEEAGRKLNKTVGSIYAARSRIMRRLRDEIQQMGFLWEEDADEDSL
jgi:RNA polymerase sigma-70 factor, ECF subfamily